ncbi:solute:Na+ symporter, SSS family [Flagellimonas taeanensis]|uniref:Solute:Na+ symporter, SSS family n=1 Tax=Flagellimonas taeanensis TaxID=1005926 RepID=A0A1M6WU08_9FLAO|nr:sodium/solute symporter [Allomuricauda taeanensis]MEE1964181.1 sodium/solute symporter [Allomuricauda taeanensis]SFC00334.1 solute:Na+ symporter, SSS family [Allomuricauda taeanensis]SHK97270.1 solute:Na+ symporter, SSS family [Allomuricauda taeanensis]
MKLGTIDITIFAIYILAILVLGLYASRFNTKTKKGYFLAGDKLPWWMIGGSIIAANISSHHLVGAMGVAYSRGFVAITLEWAAILLGFNALLWVFLPYYLRNGFYTIPEYLQVRYGNLTRAVYAVLILFTYIFVEIGAVLFLGALSLYALFDIPIIYSILSLAILTGIYTIIGGLRAVVWTEMVQLIVLVTGGIILTFATVKEAGGIQTVIDSAQNWKMIYPADDPDFPWTMYLGGLLCISVFYCATNQFIVQRILAAKNEWHGRMGVIFGNYLKFLVPLIITVPALVAPLFLPDLDKPDLLFATLVEKLLPTGLIGLVMAGLISAIMSHISGAINSCTTILTVDIYMEYFNKNASDSQAIRFGKKSGIVIIMLGIVSSILLISYSDKPVFLYLMNLYGLFTPGIATMFLMGVFWKRTTASGALVAGLITIPLSLLIEFLLPDMPFFNRTGIVFWTCMLACFVVSLLTKPKTDAELEGLIWNKESLKLPVKERSLYKGIRNPFYWWLLITVIVLYFYVRYF